MKHEEIITALRVLCGRDGQSCEGNCAHCPANQFREKHPSQACGDGTMSAAIDLIESLQADNALLLSEIKRCTSGNGTYISVEAHSRDIIKLQAQFSEAQRECDAAVECVEEVEFSLANSRFSAAWAAVRKWRGRNAGKGESE